MNKLFITQFKNEKKDGYILKLFGRDNNFNITLPSEYHNYSIDYFKENELDYYIQLGFNEIEYMDIKCKTHTLHN
jgi:hypothetical protein